VGFEKLIEAPWGFKETSTPQVVFLAARGELKRMEIGRLGAFDIRPGFYAYVGSAFGSGGLRAGSPIISRLSRRSALASRLPHVIRRASGGLVRGIRPQTGAGLGRTIGV